MDTPQERLEEQIAQWRAYVRGGRRIITTSHLDELEDSLRSQVTSLLEVGLSPDEAFLIALKRLGDAKDGSEEFPDSPSLRRLWNHLLVTSEIGAESQSDPPTETILVLGLATLAAISVKIPELFGVQLLDGGGGFYLRNLSFFVLPFLVVYFGWKRGLDTIRGFGLATSFVVSVVLVNVFPFASSGATEVLAAIHLPIALWLAVGIAYAGDRWSTRDGRMDFVRFSGELFIYYVLIALGGGVLILVTVFLFDAIGLDAEDVVQSWLLPCGAAGGFLIAAWLVDAERYAISNMAPVLTRLFTPLFSVVLLVFLGTMAWTRTGIDIERNVLIGFDLLLVLIVGLQLYALSARNPEASPGLFDALQVLLVVSALLVDLLALTAIAVRITEFGFSANKAAALGLNLVLLVNLTWSAWLYLRFVRGGGSFSRLEHWQTSYLPVYAAWAGFVVAVFPPLFGYV